MQTITYPQVTVLTDLFLPLHWNFTKAVQRGSQINHQKWLRRNKNNMWN